MSILSLQNLLTMKHKNIIIIWVLLIGMTAGTYGQQTNSAQQEMNKYTTERDPFLAAGLSAITLGFGGGQYYNKQYVKGGILSAIGVGSVIWMLSVDTDGFLGGLNVLGGAALLGASWIYSIIDAPISAATINRKYGLSPKVSLRPSIERNIFQENIVNVGLKLSLNLD